MTRICLNRGALLCMAGLLLAPSAFSQTKTIRIVTYNIEDDIDGATAPLPGLIAPWQGGPASEGGVLEGLGEEYASPDAAQPIDILALEETTSNPATIVPIVDGLNAFYGSTNMYAMSPYQATESGGDVADGNGPNALVYNTTTVQLVASVPVDPTGGTGKLGSASGEYREVMRYEFAPAWAAADPSNEFYIYVSHYKSGSTSADLTDRAEEAVIIRNDEAANLPASARVLYVGDYNVTSSAEASYQTILAAAAPNGTAQGQGVDPLNPSGANNIDWGASTTSQAILAMETESAMNLRYRDDLEVMTTNVYLGALGGLAWVSNTYHAFGNNGSVAYNGNIGAGGDNALTNLVANAGIPAATLYLDLTNASDHLPVVSDYTLPFNPPPLALGISGGAGFQIVISNADGSAITAGQAYYIEAQTAANVGGPWMALAGFLTLTNGQLQLAATPSVVAQNYYRAVETP